MKLNLTRVFATLFFLSLIGLSGYIFIDQDSEFDIHQRKISRLQIVREHIREQLQPFFERNELAPYLYFEKFGAFEKTDVKYTFDPNLQNRANILLKRYKPDYASIVAIDATTGRVLALANYIKDENDGPLNIATRATFPAASIFKIIPASVALDKYNFESSLSIPFNGSLHTLYRKNVLSDVVNRWTRFMSLKQAFAKSVNTFFGRLALKKMQPDDIREYAERFQFNKPIVTDFPVDTSTAIVPDEKGFELAEVASGFNRFNTLSPVQGAMMAAAIAHDGVVRIPYVVDTLINEKGEIVYEAEPIEIEKALTQEGAAKMRELMQATVIQGTSRKSFKPLVRNHQFMELEMGGKTGSLTGNEPRGKVDWFVGYANFEDRKIAIAAITINKKYWTVKSAFLAQSIFKSHFKEEVASR